MRKRILLVFLAVLAVLTLAACGGGSGLKVAKSSVSIDVGQTETVAITTSKDNVSKLEVSSSNQAVATATISGDKVSIKGVAAGNAVISIKVKDTKLESKINVTVKATATGARFEGHTGIFYIDASGNLETEVRDALADIKAYDDDNSLITSELIIEGIEQIDVSAGSGTQFELQIKVMKANGEAMTAVITVEVIGEATNDRIVIFGPSKLVYYIGSVNFDLAKEFSAINLGTKENVPISLDYIVGEQTTLGTPGEYPVTVIAEQGNLKEEKTITVRTRSAVTLPNELGTSSAANPITIRFGHGNGQDIHALFEKYAQWFEAKMLEEGHYVKVDVEQTGSNYDEVLTNITKLMQTNDKLPHIVQNYPDHLVEYNGYGKIESLTPYVFHPVWGFTDEANDSWYDIVQSYRDEQRSASKEGDILSLPFNKSTEFVLYNKDMFDEVLKGKPFPETWEELIALAPALRQQIDSNIARIAAAYNRAGNTTYTPGDQAAAKAEFYPFSYDSGGNAFITLTKQWGGEYTAQARLKADKLRFVNDQTKQMLMYFAQNRSDFTSPAVWNNARYATDLFLKGYSAFSVSSTAGADKNTPLVGTSKLFNIGVAPLPYSRLYPEHRNVIQQGTNFAITKHDDHTQDEKIVAFLFLKFLNESKTSLDYAFEKGYFPTRYSSLETEEYATFLAKANNPIEDGISKTEADLIMRAKAAQVYFMQKDFMVFDLPFIGSSAVRTKVETTFKDTLLSAAGDNMSTKIDQLLQMAYDEAMKVVQDDIE